MQLNIRWRLTLWYTLALASALCLFGGSIYLLFQQMHERIDRALEERVEHALGHVDQSLMQQLRQLQNDSQIQNEPIKRLSHWIFEFKEHVNIFCVIYDSTGKVVLRTQEMATVSVPAAASLAAPGFHEADIPVLGKQRVLRGALHVGKEKYGVVLLASLDEVDRDRSEVNRERVEVGRE